MRSAAGNSRAQCKQIRVGAISSSGCTWGRALPHVTQNEVLHALVTGGAQVAAWVTIPEGFTAEQIAARLQNGGLGSSAALRREFMQETLLVDGIHTKGLEGFLFPSTYLMPLGAAPEQIAALLTGQFLKELPRDAASRARALHVSVTQAVTVASLVEREAKSQTDRPEIAAVIYNRLHLGMPLQVDATIEYALPEHKSALSFADLRIDSPYNSYVHAGLPPTPIANPGLSSLEAAFHPAKSENLYYVYCGNGRHVFAKTLAEHNRNVATYLHGATPAEAEPVPLNPPPPVVPARQASRTQQHCRASPGHSCVVR